MRGPRGPRPESGASLSLEVVPGGQKDCGPSELGEGKPGSVSDLLSVHLCAAGRNQTFCLTAAQGASTGSVFCPLPLSSALERLSCPWGLCQCPRAAESQESKHCVQRGHQSRGIHGNWTSGWPLSEGHGLSGGRPGGRQENSGTGWAGAGEMGQAFWLRS